MIPSRGSEIHSERLCRGKKLATQDLSGENSTKYSEDGKRMHLMLATFDFTGATPEEMEVIEDLLSMSAEVKAEVLAGCGNPLHLYKEEPFAIHDADGNLAVTLHPDLVTIAEHPEHGLIGLVEDWKTGFIEVDSAEDNDQIRSYALGVYEKHPELNKIYGKIHQRFVAHQTVEYDRESLVLAKEDILSVVVEANKPGQPRTPSPGACRYCRALGTTRCPETLNTINHAARPINLATLSPEQKSYRLDMFKLAELIIRRERELYSAELEENPKAIPGWHLVPGDERRAIVDVQAAYAVVADKITPEEFQAKCKIGVGDFEKLYKKATGLKGLTAKNAMTEALGPALQASQCKASLEPIDPKKLLEAA